MQIMIKITRNYGKEAVYPVCETAHKFAELLGQTTFTKADLAIIKRLGYEIVIQPQTLAKWELKP